MNELSGAILSITLVMMAVFIPVSFMTGTSGTFYRQFGLTMAFAIGLSALNALTLTPALCAIMLKPHNKDEEEHEGADGARIGKKQSPIARFHTNFNLFYDAILKKYKNGVLLFIHHRWLAFGSVVAGIALLIGLMMYTPTGLVPNEDTGTIFAVVNLPPATSQERTLAVMQEIDQMFAAEMSLAGTYYNANAARAAFYPQITLSGSAGWTNSAGGAILNPAKLLASVVGSLTQPLFYRGANIARLKIAKAQQEEAKLAFEQTLLNAGSEVSNALSLYQTTSDKAASRTLQVEASQRAAEYTKELFQLSTSTSYLEVLAAEQSLLSARLSQVSDSFDRMQAVVSLYQALGGGREE